MPDTGYRDNDRITALINTAVETLGDALYLASTATNEQGRREADEVHRRVRESLVMLAADNPGLLADVVVYVLEPFALLPAEQIEAAKDAAMVCLDRPALIPEFRAWRTR